MARPKRVAIIGAGPSGLVTAKTLLKNFPPGTFSPVVFEKKPRIGGLWAVDYPPESHTPSSNEGVRRHRAFIDPWMRTNLSRHSVAFSDLSWETALGKNTDDVPIFPYAWQVRKYLEKYAELNIPKECLRLGARVFQVQRRDDSEVKVGHGRWEILWMDTGNEDQRHAPGKSRVRKDDFDFLVVASGHFGSPDIPQIPGFESFPNVIHSSELQDKEDISRLLLKSPRPGKLVVIGGSLSGVEAATSLALHLSSLTYSPDFPTHAKHAYEVVHVAPGPFWVLPKYMPRHYETDSVGFVPLDLSLYDLERRPQGPIEVSFGPISSDQIIQRIGFFQDMLGQDYSQNGGFNRVGDSGKEDRRPPWTSISDYYAGFVRSGAIEVVAGRAIAIDNIDSGIGTIRLNTSSGPTNLTNVAAVIMATGFKPSKSLSFLPQDVLSALDYLEEDHSMPLILDSWSSGHSDIPDLGFVGFYRGAFWGPAELQAQMHAKTWVAFDTNSEASASLWLSLDEKTSRAAERERVRALRDFRPVSRRGQFVLGDYVGLMETLARNLGRRRLPIGTNDGGTLRGPVVPVRYASLDTYGNGSVSSRGSTREEVEISLKALRGTSVQSCTSMAAAIFRALHGQWEYKRTDLPRNNGDEEVRASGRAAFYPCYPSCPGHEAEYLYEEVQDDRLQLTKKSIYRLRGTASFKNFSGIRVWSVDDRTGSNAVNGPPLEVHVEPLGSLLSSGKVQVLGFAKTSHSVQHSYEFYFDQVAVRSWQHVVYTNNEGQTSECRTFYTRPGETSHEPSAHTWPPSLL